ncbi:type II toxin-antitoxin system VapC family toxin [Azospirillum rugosum]|uniref:Ribonuclease VapC n=1 Tax=Azospirillum rugosum TaxID=416170 RepID=A0ABS4SS43_9PROT|nr:type II toxin-antitoxin system VapC family toxin [Azospirillum rugosum]MBP2295379.1 putative nucleic acid-binding protein [Azospirillum rugosum]MDQ0528754.1 putative nucleic acid-binding protein [Azospirillum rugosum]
MSARVLDASVAVRWFFPEEGREAALDLLRTSSFLYAPDLLVSEACNVAWKKVRLGQATPDQAIDVAKRLRTFFAELIPSQALAPRAVEIALDLGHPVYDAFYVALAEQRSLTLITADRRLVSRVAGTRYAPYVHPLE